MMPTLGQQVGETTHCSALLRRARSMGLRSPADFVRLAVVRGCSHYARIYPALEMAPDADAISNEELVGLLLIGENTFEPLAIRCAAQLAGDCDATRLAILAKRERFERVLAYIAAAGRDHDERNRMHWVRLLGLLGDKRPLAEGSLPHWSRFVLQTGVSRGGGGSIEWLHSR